MRVVSGKVVDGKVVVQGDPSDEGAVVTIVAREDDETFDVSDEDEAALEAAIAEADRGDVVAADAAEPSPTPVLASPHSGPRPRSLQL